MVRNIGKLIASYLPWTWMYYFLNIYSAQFLPFIVNQIISMWAYFPKQSIFWAKLLICFINSLTSECEKAFASRVITECCLNWKFSKNVGIRSSTHGENVTIALKILQSVTNICNPMAIHWRHSGYPASVWKQVHFLLYCYILWLWQTQESGIT